LCGVLFGVLTFISPLASLAALVILYGAYAFTDGVFSIISALRRRGSWWSLLLQGIVGIGAGIVTVVWPGITALALLYVIAVWAIMTGALEIAAAIRLRKAIEHEWLLGFSGLVSIGLGAMLIAYPGPGALTLVLWIGAFAFVAGLVRVILSLKLRSWGGSHRSHSGHSALSPA